MELTPEEREQKRQERLARESSITSELEEMDSIWSDVVEAKEEEKEVVVEEPVVQEVVEPEVTAETEAEAGAEAEVEPEEDEYAIGDMINQLAREAMQKQAEVSTQEPIAEKAEVAPITPVITPTAAPQSIVSLEEMSEAFNSPEKFVEILNRVYTAGVSAASERALLQLPQVARQVSIQVANQAEMHRRFYDEHQELANYKDFVAYCATQVEAKHPDWNHQQILVETAKVAKSRLPALRRAKRDAQGRPALPGSGKAGARNRPTAQAVTALEQEIDDMPNRF